MKRSLPLKTLLREQAIPALTAARPYFSVEMVRKEVAARKWRLADATLLNYLQELVRLGHIHDAGRGWYSTLEKRLEVDRGIIAPVVTAIAKDFPFLAFSAWSTQQINPWMHHLLGRFVTFVHVENEGVNTVWEFLRDAGYDAYRDPGKREAKTFAVRDRTVVVRPGNPSQAPVEGHYALPEKILVDLAGEIDVLHLMDPAEFNRLFASAALAGRLDIADTIAYSKRKRLLSGFLKHIDSITAQNAFL